MQLSELIADISDECNKSTLTDAIIRSRIKRALMFFERAHDFVYMQQFVEETLDASSATPRRLDQPARLRAVNFVRIVHPTGEYTQLHKVDPKDVTANESGDPTGYWASGTDYWYFDNIPSEDVNLELGYEQFTTFSTEDTFEPWLLETSSDLIFHQSVMYLASYLREPELYQLHKPMRDEALQTVLTLNEEMKFSDQPMRMGYGHN